MRILTLTALFCALAAPAQSNGHWPGPGDRVVPHAGGLVHIGADGATRPGMPFGTGFQDTMHVLVAIYGPDVRIGFPQECGEGPMVSAHIPGQIDLMFRDDQLAGWMLIDDGRLQLDPALGVGSPLAALAARGPVTTFESGIGTEFALGDLFGLLSEDGATVQAIWTGATCIFR
jgi:hypothetical protein